MIKTEERLKVIERRAKGESIAKIAKALKMGKDKVVTILRESREEVAALEALELDAFYEAEKLTIKERIRRLSRLSQRLLDEVESRDLTDVPTEKLIDLYLKSSSALDAAIVEPDLRSTEEVRQEREERLDVEQLG